MTDTRIDLAGKVAVVTGAASGIGLEIARRLAQSGSTVVIADVRDYAASAAAENLSAAGLSAHGRALDVGKRAAVAAWMSETCRAFGRLDILVNCAGVLTVGPVIEGELEDWEKVNNVNLSGTLYCAHGAAKVMKDFGGGRIVNIASISAMRGSGRFGNALYGTTKGAVTALTMGLAREFGPVGITVNAVLPGVVSTPMTESLMTDELVTSTLARIPLGRFTTAGDVADASLFLVSDLAAGISGALLPVDGGYLVS